jgi:hypothetical protein
MEEIGVVIAFAEFFPEPLGKPLDDALAVVGFFPARATASK